MTFTHDTLRWLRKRLAVLICIWAIHSPCNSIADLSNGLIAYYPFNGSAYDASDHGNTGVINGAPSLIQDRFGDPNRAYSFAGINDYIQLPYTSTLCTSSFTLSAWVYFDVYSTDNNTGDIVLSDYEYIHFTGYIFYVNYLGKVSLRLSSGTFPNGGIDLAGTNSVSLAHWTHVAASYDGNTLRVYLNGIQDGSTSGWTIYNWNSSVNTLIGNASWYPTANPKYKGRLDDVRIYNRALTASEIAQLYDQEAAATLSLPSYSYDPLEGRHAIKDIGLNINKLMSFVFATQETGSKCLVSWTTNFREWFALLNFDATTVGTEVIDTSTAQQKFYRTTYLPSGVSPADHFDYPIGGSGDVPEQISPERNNLYPSGATANPDRGAVSPVSGWYNIQDVGSYYTNPAAGGLHPGEDWNKGGAGEDIGESVKAVANGQVIDIRPAAASGVPTSRGYVMVIRHWLLNGDSVDSLYVHIAPDKNGGIVNSNGVIGAASNFTYQEGAAVTKGSIIGVIGAPTSVPSHLHFEMRNKAVNVGGELWPSDNGNGYYGPEIGPTGVRTQTISQQDVEAAFLLMQTDGIIDPSDFIDDHR